MKREAVFKMESKVSRKVCKDQQRASNGQQSNGVALAPN